MTGTTTSPNQQPAVEVNRKFCPASHRDQRVSIQTASRVTERCQAVQGILDYPSTIPDYDGHVDRRAVRWQDARDMGRVDEGGRHHEPALLVLTEEFTRVDGVHPRDTELGAPGLLPQHRRETDPIRLTTRATLSTSSAQGTGTEKSTPLGDRQVVVYVYSGTPVRE